jgi:hypothetical protein
MSSVLIGSLPEFSMVKSRENGLFTVANDGRPARFKFTYQLFDIAYVHASAISKDKVKMRFIQVY